MLGHHHQKMQDSVGELQGLQPRVSAATHALAVVRSHYPATDLQAIGGGFAEGLSEVETQQLEDEVEDTAKKLAGDIDLFDEMDSNSRAQ